MKSNLLIYLIAAILFTTDIYVHARKLNPVPDLQDERIDKPIVKAIFSTARYHKDCKIKSAPVIPPLFPDFSKALSKLDDRVFVPPEKYSLRIDVTNGKHWPAFQPKSLAADDFADNPGIPAGNELLTVQVTTLY